MVSPLEVMLKKGYDCKELLTNSASISGLQNSATNLHLICLAFKKGYHFDQNIVEGIMNKYYEDFKDQNCSWAFTKFIKKMVDDMKPVAL